MEARRSYKQKTHRIAKQILFKQSGRVLRQKDHRIDARSASGGGCNRYQVHRCGAVVGIKLILLLHCDLIFFVIRCELLLARRGLADACDAVRTASVSMMLRDNYFTKYNCLYAWSSEPGEV